MRCAVAYFAAGILLSITIGCGGGADETTVADSGEGASGGEGAAAAPAPAQESPGGGSPGGSSGEYDDGGYGDYEGEDESEENENDDYDDEYGEEMSYEEDEEGYSDDYGDDYSDDYSDEYSDEYSEEEGSGAYARQGRRRPPRGPGSGGGSAGMAPGGGSAAMAPGNLGVGSPPGGGSAAMAPGNLGVGGPPGYPGESYSEMESGEYEGEYDSEYGEEYTGEEYAGAPGSYPPGGYAPGAYPPGAGRPGQPRTPPPPPGYDALAQFAFQQGREGDAFQYLYAFALTNDQGANDLFGKIHWVPELKRPMLGYRWGVGVQISPDNFRGDLKPVGSVQQLPSRRGGGRSGYGGGGGSDYGGEGDQSGYSEGPMGPGGGGMGRGQDGTLSRYAGELGTRLLTEYETRRAKGEFGEVLQAAVVAAGAANRGGGGGFSGGYGEEYSDEYGEEEEYGSYSGPPASSAPPGFGAPGGGPGFGRGGRPGQMAGGAPAVPSLPSLAPGLAFLGVDKLDKLLEKAAEEDIQILMLFDVEVSLNRKTNLTTNKTEIRLVDVATKAKLNKKKIEFNNLKVQNDRSQNKDDGIEEGFEELFAFVDAGLVMAEIPAILTEKPEYVKNRVAGLTAAKTEKMLPVLAEIRFWQTRNLISEGELLEAYKLLIGDEAEALATGDEDAKKEVVAKWLPK